MDCLMDDVLHVLWMGLADGFVQSRAFSVDKQRTFGWVLAAMVTSYKTSSSSSSSSSSSQLVRRSFRTAGGCCCFE